MLKRQRPASPSPQSSIIPFFTDTSSDITDRNAKRRRTDEVMPKSPYIWSGPCVQQQPPLQNSAGALPPDFEEEIYSEDGDDDDYRSDDRFASRNLQLSEYANANSVLRELHTLNQHRLLFAEPDMTTANSTNMQYASYPPYFNPSKGDVPQLQERPLSHAYPFPHSNEKGLHLNDENLLVDELNFVTLRYESTNKLIGDAVLSRRRALESQIPLS